MNGNFGVPRSRARSVATVLLLSLLWACPFISDVRAQSVTPSPGPQPSASASPTPLKPQAIPLADVVQGISQASSTLHDLQAGLQADDTVSVIAADLPALINDVSQRLASTNRLAITSPSLDNLRAVENDWQQTAERLDAWNRELERAENLRQAAVAQLTTLSEVWKETLQTAQKASLSSTLMTEIRHTSDALARGQGESQQDLLTVLTVQAQINQQRTRVSAALDQINRLRTHALDRLLERDSVPLWSLQPDGGMMSSVASSLSTQISLLMEYVNRHLEALLLQLLLFCVFELFLSVARRQLSTMAASEPTLTPAMHIFNAPLCTALLITIVSTLPMFHQAPRLLFGLFGAAALFPALVLLRRLVSRRLYPLLYVLMTLYLLEHVRDVLNAVPFVSRWLYLLETLAAAGYLSHRLARSTESGHRIDAGRYAGVWRTFALTATLLLLLTSLANVVGNVSLADLVGRTVFRSAFLGFVLYAALDVVDAALVYLMYVRPLSTLNSITANRETIRHRIRLVSKCVAWGLWLLLTLDMVSLRQPMRDVLAGMLDSHLNVGAVSVSIGDFLAFLITLWSSFALSRLIRTILDEDIYPRIRLNRGIPYAISTIVNYGILLLGFFFALAVLGVDFSRFVVLAGAFGVGIGFGLQTIVNNFVSGLILLFERPIKVGDSIQIGDVRGTVQRIGIRASVVRTWDSADVIVPNGTLLAERVSNWSYSNNWRGVEVTVGVDPKAPPQRVFDILLAAASSQSDVLKKPAPRVYFDGFGERAWKYRLRAWIENSERLNDVSSEIGLAINQGLHDAGIEIPLTP